MALDPTQIKSLLEDAATRSRTRRSPAKDVTEPREVTVWFKLPHKIADFSTDDGGIVVPHCENPDCSDPRPRSDKGRNVVSVVKGKMMCRYCFLSGWLSDGQP